MKLIVEVSDKWNSGEDFIFTVEAAAKSAVLVDFANLEIPTGGSVNWYGYDFTKKECYQMGDNGRLFKRLVIEVYEVDEWVASKMRTK